MNCLVMLTLPTFVRHQRKHMNFQSFLLHNVLQSQTDKSHYFEDVYHFFPPVIFCVELDENDLKDKALKFL